MRTTRYTGRIRAVPSSALMRSGMAAAFLATSAVGIAGTMSCTANAQAFVGWGQNASGQLDVPAKSMFKAVAPGNFHTIGLRLDGTVVGWGCNDNGQCTPPAGLMGVVQVAAGGWWYQIAGGHSAALLTDGTVQAWGNNDYGQCTVPPGTGQVIQVVCGWAHTAVLKSDHSVVVWGAGDLGINGDPHWGQRYVPRDLGDITSISTKGCHVMALRSDGAVRCWGRGAEGQSAVPSSLATIVEIAAGSDHSIALAADGVATCWGWDYHRQVSLTPQTERFSRIAASMYGSMGLTRDGRVLVWGLLDQPPSSLICIRTVVAGGYHAFAELVDTDGDGPCDSIDNCPTIPNPTQADCDIDGIGDVCEIAAGAPDFNNDTIPDACQCIADLFVDHQVNGADLGALLAFWGPVNPGFPQADLNRDAKVDGADLGYLLASWGACTN